MAHPIVEKLKVQAIRHGEKAGVAVASAVALLMLWSAFSKPSIDLTTDQVKNAAAQAQQNIQKTQKDEDILAKLETQGIVQPNFEKLVDARKPGTADASPYQLSNLMITPEPGAGLLREMPELIAVAMLEAHPGRGAMNLFEIDPVTGEVVYEKPDDPSNKKSARNRGTARRGSTKSKADSEKARKDEEARFKKGLAGGANRGPETKEDEPKPETRPDGSVAKENLKGQRWVVLTGLLDHKRLRDNYAKALKVDLAGAHPHYLRLDVERQQRRDDGSWTDWKVIDRKRIEEQVLNTLTEVEEEVIPETSRIKALVDRLPFLEVGYWVGVHPVELVPKELLETKSETAAAGGRPGGFDGDSGGMMGAAGGMMGPGGRGGRGGGMGGMSGMMGGAAGGMMGPGGRGGMGGMMGGGTGGGGGSMSGFGSMFGASGGGGDTNYDKTEADKLMVRSIDFTVEPDSIYRYRVRLVVQNPNLGLESVMPGVDKETKELTGPWSDLSSTVAIPADVATYVMDFAPSGPEQKRDDRVMFQVVRYQPDSGLTIVTTSTDSPGMIVGDAKAAGVPDLDNRKIVSQTVDFTSRRVLVDVAGGSQSVEGLKLGTAAFDAPARAVLLRSDGTLIVRDEASDANDGEMIEMKKIYDQTLVDAKGEKKSSALGGGFGGMEGMMGGAGGYGGMMGGGGGGGSRGGGTGSGASR